MHIYTQLYTHRSMTVGLFYFILFHCRRPHVCNKCCNLFYCSVYFILLRMKPHRYNDIFTNMVILAVLLQFAGMHNANSALSPKLMQCRLLPRRGSTHLPISGPPLPLAEDMSFCQCRLVTSFLNEPVGVATLPISQTIIVKHYIVA